MVEIKGTTERFPKILLLVNFCDYSYDSSE